MMVTEFFYYGLTIDVTLIFQAEISEHDSEPPYIMKMLKPIPGSLKMCIGGKPFTDVGNGVIPQPEYPRKRSYRVTKEAELFSSYLKCSAV